MDNRFLSRAYAFSLVLVFILINFLSTGSSQAQAQIDLIIHSIESQPIEGDSRSEVYVYFSIFDSAGNSLRDLSTSDINIVEDGRRINMDSVDPATNEPISIILALDTSGSMGGSGIASAREAASTFVSRLNEKDTISVISFNDNITSVIDQTDNHQSAKAAIEQMDAIRNAGTCLYDAAYQSVQMAAALPPGRRAVLILTDGVDETISGQTCSTYTLDDVINLAISGPIRVPIYTLGLGNQIDEKSLERVAALTGGRYFKSADPSQLEDLFQNLSEQLQSQYVLSYISTSAPGAHNLVVEVNRSGLKGQDSQNFILAAPPPSLSILNPLDGTEVSGSQTITASISTPTTPVARVLFQIAGEEVGSDAEPPYEFEWDVDKYPPGEIRVIAIAQGIDGIEIARDEISLVIPEAVIPVEELETQELPTVVDDTQSETPIEVTAEVSRNTYLLPIVLAVIGLIVISSIIIYVRRRTHGRYLEDAGNGGDDLDNTIDNLVLPATLREARNFLTILDSDDASLIGQRIDLLKTSTTLGRNTENDIIFPKDSPVSRFHAIIEQIGEQVILKEVVVQKDDGTEKRPTYGTYVNDLKMENEPYRLKNGDVVRLGNRVKLRFETSQKAEPDNDDTIDSINLSDQSDTTEIQRE